MISTLVIFGLLVLLCATLYKNNNWYQDLNKDESRKRKFFFRGSTSLLRRPIRYEFASGPACRLKIGRNYDGDGLQVSIGFIFGTAYISTTCPKFLDKVFKEDYETGFYFHEWSLVWSWNQWTMGSMPKPQPWYKKFYFHIDEFFLGKWLVLTDEMTGLSGEQISFMFRDSEYVMDSIKFNRVRRFRSYIPFSWYHGDYVRCELKIDNAPRYAGKGENSWDCDDNATHGSSFLWDGPELTWRNREAVLEHAISRYCNDVHKNIKRYGRASGDKLTSKESAYEYIGYKQRKDFGTDSGATPVGAT